MTPQIQSSEEREERIKKAFQGLDAPNEQIDKYVKGSANPKQAKARMANMAYIASRSGQDLAEVTKLYDSNRARLAEELFDVKEDPGDEGLYGLIQGQYEREKHIEGEIDKVVDHALDQAILNPELEAPNGDIVNVPWKTGYSQWEVARTKEPKFNDEKAKRQYEQHYRVAYEEGLRSSSEAKRLAKDLYDQLKIEEGVEEEGPIKNAKPESIERLQMVSPQERQVIYRLLQRHVDTGDVPEDWSTMMRQRVVQGFKQQWGLLDARRAERIASQILNDGPVSVYTGPPGMLELQGETVKLGNLTVSLQGPDTTGGQAYFRELTPEEREEIKGLATEMRTQSDIARELRGIRNEIADASPEVRSDQNSDYRAFLAQKVVGPALEQVGIMSQAAGLWSMPLLQASIQQQRFEELVDKGVSREDANTIAGISSIIEAPLERLQLKMLGGGLARTMASWRQGLTKKLGAAGVALGEQIVVQNAQEAVQDIMPYAVASLADHLGHEFETFGPEQKEKFLKDFKDSRWDTFWALLPMTFLGAGISRVVDAANNARMLANKKSLVDFGIDEESAEKISNLMGQGKTKEAEKEYQKAYANKNPADTSKIDAANKARENLTKSPFRPTIIKGQNGKYEVMFPGGEITDAADLQSAQQLVDDYQNTRADRTRVEVGDLLENEAAVEEMVQNFSQIPGLDVLGEERQFTAQDLIEEGYASTEEVRQRIIDYGNEVGKDYSDAPFTMFNVDATHEFREDIQRDVVRLFNTRRPTALVEDVSERVPKRLIREGRREELRSELKSYQESSGDTIVANIDTATDASLVEGFSSLAVAYFTGKVKESSLSERIKNLFKQIGEYMKYLVARYAKIRAAVESGAISKDFESLLAESVGLQEGTIQKSAATDAERKTLRSLIKEVKDTAGQHTASSERIKKAQEILSKASESQIREAFKNNITLSISPNSTRVEIAEDTVEELERSEREGFEISSDWFINRLVSFSSRVAIPNDNLRKMFQKFPAIFEKAFSNIAIIRPTSEAKDISSVRRFEDGKLIVNVPLLDSPEKSDDERMNFYVRFIGNILTAEAAYQARGEEFSDFIRSAIGDQLISAYINIIAELPNDVGPLEFANDGDVEQTVLNGFTTKALAEDLSKGKFLGKQLDKEGMMKKQQFLSAISGLDAAEKMLLEESLQDPNVLIDGKVDVKAALVDLQSFIRQRVDIRDMSTLDDPRMVMPSTKYPNFSMFSDSVPRKEKAFIFTPKKSIHFFNERRNHGPAGEKTNVAGFVRYSEAHGEQASGPVVFELQSDWVREFDDDTPKYVKGVVDNYPNVLLRDLFRDAADRGDTHVFISTTDSVILTERKYNDDKTVDAYSKRYGALYDKDSGKFQKIAQKISGDKGRLFSFGPHRNGADAENYGFKGETKATAIGYKVPDKFKRPILFGKSNATFSFSFKHATVLTPIDLEEFQFNSENDEFLYHVTTRKALEGITKDGELKGSIRSIYHDNDLLRENSDGYVFFAEKSNVRLWMYSTINAAGVSDWDLVAIRYPKMKVDLFPVGMEPDPLTRAGNYRVPGNVTLSISPNELFKDGNWTNTKKVAEFLEANGQNASVGRRVLESVFDLPLREIVPDSMPVRRSEDSRAWYDRGSRVIALNSDSNLEEFEEDFIHEVTHGLTIDLYNKNPDFKKETDRLRDLVFEAIPKKDRDSFRRRVETAPELLEYALKTRESFKSAYGFDFDLYGVDGEKLGERDKLVFTYMIKNPYELFAVPMGEPKMLGVLAQIQDPEGKSLLQKFIDLLKQVFGFDSGGTVAESLIQLVRDYAAIGEDFYKQNPPNQTFSVSPRDITFDLVEDGNDYVTKVNVAKPTGVQRLSGKVDVSDGMGGSFGSFDRDAAMSTFEGSSEAIHVRKYFGSAYEEDSVTHRISGISVPDSKRGIGLGKAIYLAHARNAEVKTGKTVYFYNSDRSPEAARATEALAKDGLIKIKGLFRDDMSGPAAWVLTDKGRLTKPRDLIKDTTTFSFTSDSVAEAIEDLFRPPDERVRMLNRARRRVAQVARKAENLRRAHDTNERILTRTDVAEAVGLLEGVVRALPVSLRGQIQGFETLAQRATPAGRLSTLRSKIAQVDRLIDEHLATQHRERFYRTLERGRAKIRARKASNPTWGPEVAQAVVQIEAVAGLSTEEVDRQLTAINDMEPSDTNTVANAERRRFLLTHFGALNSMNAAQIEEAHGLLDTYLRTLRAPWDQYREQRRAQMDTWRQQIRHEIGRPQAPSREDVARARNVEDKTVRRMVNNMKQFSREHFSWGQLLQSLMPNSNIAEMWERRVLGAKNNFVDASIARRDAFQNWMIDTLRLTSGWRRDKWLAEQKEKKPSGAVTAAGQDLELSQNEAIYYTMIWSQQTYRSNLETHDGITEDTMAQIEEYLTPESRQLRQWLWDQYAQGYGSINEVYERLNGAPLPQVDQYSPASIDLGEGEDMQLDPLNMTTTTTGLVSGFTKMRTKHSLPIRRMDALNLYWAHVHNTEYYKAYAETVRDIRGVFQNRDVANTIITEAGPDRMRIVNGWVHAFQNNGFRAASARIAIDKWFDRMSQTLSVIGLAYNMVTIVKQVSAAFGSFADRDIAASDWFMGAMRVAATGFAPNTYRMWREPVIQRRIGAHFGVDIQRAKSEFTEMNYIGRTITEYGLASIGHVDAGFTAFSAAVAYEAHRRAARRLTDNEAEIHRIAMERTELTVARTAQPIANPDRSLIEIKADSNGVLKLLTVFRSEPRQKLAITLQAANRAVRDLDWSAARAAQVAWLLLPWISYVAGDWVSSYARRDPEEPEPDEETKLNEIRFKLAAGQTSGIFVFGDAIELLAARFFEQKVWLSGADPVTKATFDMWRSIEDGIDGEFDVKDAKYLANGIAMLAGGYTTLASQGVRLYSDITNAVKNVDYNPLPGQKDYVTERLKELNVAQEVLDKGLEDLKEREEKREDSDAKEPEVFKKIRSLKVKSGLRAQGIKALLENTPEDERAELTKQLKDAKLLSSTVQKQINQLK